MKVEGKGMVEREAQRVKEAEAKPFSLYEADYSLAAEKRKRAIEGKVVIKGSERPWRQSRQGHAKHFLTAFLDDTALMGWRFFMQDIRTHSGSHRHQGGLAIFVIDGRGWTVVDGVRHDWEEGDLIVLPVKPGGVRHQHFNADPGKPCKWLAMIYLAYQDALGNMMEQVENSPDWSGHA
ncbi:MAG: cupin domain-containing protein [Dehalococcoidia bacterium]|nr:cupin domain-containing protein [Dehalococcoidia bacterium]